LSGLLFDQHLYLQIRPFFFFFFLFNTILNIKGYSADVTILELIHTLSLFLLTF